MEKIYVLSVIQAFLIREVISLLLRFTIFALRFANSGEYDIFRFSKSPAGLLTWQVGQTPDLKSVGKCQNPHLRRALPINFLQVACPPTPILGQTIGRCIYLAVSLTKRRLRGVKWEGPFRREEGSARVLAISARPLMSISPTPLKSSFGWEKHASCSTINKGLLRQANDEMLFVLHIFAIMIGFFFVFVLFFGK